MNDTVIGFRSVVTNDIQDHCVAVGNPYRVIRSITEVDREYWQREYRDYVDDTELNRQIVR